MKTGMRYILLVFLWAVARPVLAQDPSFSQFFSSPLNINPALTANINADWRLVSNLRDQWIGPASPYITGTISFDYKAIQNKIPNISEGNYMGVGCMLMFDHSMNGVVKGGYGSLDLSYSIKLSETDYYTERLGFGVSGTYCNKHVDFDRVDFEEQFTGFGFNRNLPTGESTLSGMKPYVSTNAGITYSATTEKTNFDVGVAVFHFNSPKQTFLNDDNQYLPPRKVVHANFEAFINEQWVFNTNGIYQFQAQAKYFSLGAAMGYNVGDEAQTLVTGGLWYWSNNAVIPYFGLAYNNLQFGVSYDITTSKLSQAARKPNTWEISFILRGKKRDTGIIPCPWK